MYKTIEFLRILSDGDKHTQEELSRKLEISKGSVKRYISQLRDCRVDIETIRGKGGGYKMKEINGEWLKK